MTIKEKYEIVKSEVIKELNSKEFNEQLEKYLIEYTMGIYELDQRTYKSLKRAAFRSVVENSYDIYLLENKGNVSKTPKCLNTFGCFFIPIYRSIQ